MTKEISKNNIAHDEEGIHLTELTELALYNSQAFECIEKMLDAGIPQYKIIRLMNKILRKEVK